MIHKICVSFTCCFFPSAPQMPVEMRRGRTGLARDLLLGSWHLLFMFSTNFYLCHLHFQGVDDACQRRRGKPKPFPAVHVRRTLEGECLVHLGVLVYLGCLCIFRALLLGQVDYVWWINIVVAQQTWILLPFLWRTLNVGEYVLWIRVTNNGVTWGLRRTRDPRFCSLLDKGCFALVGRGCRFKLECPHLRTYGGWPWPSAHPG